MCVISVMKWVDNNLRKRIKYIYNVIYFSRVFSKMN